MKLTTFGSFPRREFFIQFDTIPYQLVFFRHSLKSLDKLRWATLGYHHNWDTKIYTEENKSLFPEDLAQLGKHFATALGYPSFEAHSAIVNFYHPGSTLSGHVDSSEVDLNAPLLSFR